MTDQGTTNNTAAYDWKNDAVRVRESVEARSCLICFHDFDGAGHTKMQSKKCGHVRCDSCVKHTWSIEPLQRKCNIKGCPVVLTRNDWEYLVRNEDWRPSAVPEPSWFRTPGEISRERPLTSEEMTDRAVQFRALQAQWAAQPGTAAYTGGPPLPVGAANEEEESGDEEESSDGDDEDECDAAESGQSSGSDLFIPESNPQFMTQATTSNVDVEQDDDEE